MRMYCLMRIGSSSDSELVVYLLCTLQDHAILGTSNLLGVYLDR